MNPSDSTNKAIALSPAQTPATGDGAPVHSNMLMPALFGPAGEASPHLPPGVDGTPTVSGLITFSSTTTSLGIVTA